MYKWRGSPDLYKRGNFNGHITHSASLHHMAEFTFGASSTFQGPDNNSPRRTGLLPSPWCLGEEPIYHMLSIYPGAVPTFVFFGALDQTFFNEWVTEERFWENGTLPFSIFKLMTFFWSSHHSHSTQAYTHHGAAPMGVAASASFQ